MEIVLEKMEATVIASDEDSNLSSKSEFELLYKNWGKLGNQEERRKEILESQKYNRNNKLDTRRGILEIVDAVEENDIFKHHFERKIYYRPTIYVAGFSRVSLSYNNVLMMSEWMVEKPEDFHENWYVSPCPKGMRMLVVATRGRTKCYTKYGQFVFATRTLLPGGSQYGGNCCNLTSCCVLDCFYYESTKTLYVMDFLAWNNQPMTDCDMEFRKYWLQSKFDENPDYGKITKLNNTRLVLVPKVSCDPESFNEFMGKWPPFENALPQADGLLFYHKKAHYVSGQTPLVGWLYPYMVPEVLGADITVNNSYLAEKPANYVDQQTFIKGFEEKTAKKHARHRSFFKQLEMDTSDLPTNEAETDETTQENDQKENEDGVEDMADMATMEATFVMVEKSDAMESEELLENTKTEHSEIVQTETSNGSDKVKE